MKQNVELKKENAELIHLLKKSKELIKDEVARFKSENLLLRRFVESVWTSVEGKVDEKLREQLRPLINLREAGKMNTSTTNNTDNPSVGPPSESPKLRPSIDELDQLRQKLAEREMQNCLLASQLAETRHESESVSGYLQYVQRRDCAVPKKPVADRPTLPVDSANVGSEADEEELPPKEQRAICGSASCVLPGFIRSLMQK